MIHQSSSNFAYQVASNISTQKSLVRHMEVSETARCLSFHSAHELISTMMQGLKTTVTQPARNFVIL
jgi:hypothetical protein